MREYNIFFSWQNDNKKTKNLLSKWIDSSIKKLEETYKINYWKRPCDGMSGSPDIVNEIKNKIKRTDIFIADMSVINSINTENNETSAKNIENNNTTTQYTKKFYNNNVCFELGIAKTYLYDENIIILTNEKPDLIPFDINHDRISVFDIEKDESQNILYYIKSALEHASKIFKLNNNSNLCSYCLNNLNKFEYKIYDFNDKFSIICYNCISLLKNIDDYILENNWDRIDNGTSLYQKNIFDKLCNLKIYNYGMTNVKNFYNKYNNVVNNDNINNGIINNINNQDKWEDIVNTILKIKTQHKYNEMDEINLFKQLKFSFINGLYDNASKEYDFIVNIYMNGFEGNNFIEFYMMEIIKLTKTNIINKFNPLNILKMSYYIYENFKTKWINTFNNFFIEYIFMIFENVILENLSYNSYNFNDPIYNNCDNIFEFFVLRYILYDDKNINKIFNTLYHILYKNNQLDKNTFDNIVIQIIDIGNYLKTTSIFKQSDLYNIHDKYTNYKKRVIMPEGFITYVNE